MTKDSEPNGSKHSLNLVLNSITKCRDLTPSKLYIIYVLPYTSITKFTLSST
jgi:hypothetical protein